MFCMQVSMKACYKLIVWRWSRIPKVPKIASLQCLYSISKKKLKLKLIFCMQSFLKVYFSTLRTKVSYKVDIIIVNGHDQVFSNYSNKFAISLQYLKKEIRNGDHFWHADKSQSFYKLVLSFLMELSRHVQNTQNRKLVMFLQYIRKNVATALYSIVMHNIQIFCRGPVMFVVTSFSQIDVISIIEI